jgi:hypothetical protein
MKMALKLLMGFLFLTGLFLLTISCHDPVTPHNGPHSYPEHLFYIGSAGEGTVKVFSAEKEAFIDSLYFPTTSNYGIYYTQVIGRDEKLAVRTGLGNYLYDLANKTTTYPAFDNASGFEFSPDCRYVALLKPTAQQYTSNLELRTYPENRLIYTADSAGSPRFSLDSRLFSFMQHSQLHDARALVVYDIQKNRIIEKTLKIYEGDTIAILGQTPIASGNKSIIMASTSLGIILCASDFGSTTVRILRIISWDNGAGYTIDYNEEYIYLTTPPAWWGYPSQIIYKYDIAGEQLVAEISTESVDHEPGMSCVSFDGNYLVTGSSGRYNLGWDNICLIDLSNWTVIGAYDYVGAPGHPITPHTISSRTLKR